MFSTITILIITALATIVGIIDQAYALKVTVKFPFIHFIRKPRKKLTFIQVLLIVLAFVGCCASIIEQWNNKLEKDSANHIADSLQNVSNVFKDSVLKLNNKNLQLNYLLYNHTTRIKDSLNLKIDTIRGQNYQLSKSQFKSFDSTYRKIKQSSDTLNAYLTGKGGICYFELLDKTKGNFQAAIFNPKGYNLHAGNIRVLDLRFTDSIRTTKNRDGVLLYNQDDVEKFSRSFGVGFVPPGFSALSFTKHYTTGEVSRFEIIFHLGTEIFAQQLIFVPSESTKVYQMSKIFRYQGNAFVPIGVFNPSKFNHFSVDWEGEFKLPINRYLY